MPSAEPQQCVCKGAGFVVADVPYGHPDFGRLIPCVCKRQKQAERRAEQRAWRLARLRAELGDLAACTFETFEVQKRPLTPFTHGGVHYPVGVQRRALAALKAAALSFAAALTDGAEPAGWFLCYGPVGGGKSHIAAAIANHAAAHGIEVSYASVPRFLRFIKTGFRQFNEQTNVSEADERILAMQEVPLLVLDDLGQEQLNRWDRTVLFEIVDARYKRKTPTVITCNLSLEELYKHHEPVADRIQGMSRHTRVFLPVRSIRAVDAVDESQRAS